jgi:hypothetical protein
VAPPPPQYAPRDKEKAPYLVELDHNLIASGATPKEVATLRSGYRNLLEHLDAAVLKNLVKYEQHLVVIPKDKKLTEVAPFTALAGQKTFDGRKWEEVRGVSVESKKTGCAVAVAAENLSGDGGGYPKMFGFYHEYGHAVHGAGLLPRDSPPNDWTERLLRSMWGNPPTKEAITRLYKTSMTRPQKTDLGDYADSNEYEFFAQGTAAYFDYGYVYYKKQNGKNARFQETPSSLKKANSGLFDLCLSLYGLVGHTKH